MRKRIALWISLAAALALGLILPSGALRTIDGRLTRGEWVVEAPFGEYRYGGTLENRVRALAAYRTGSPGICYSEMEADINVDVWSELYSAGLLPVKADDAVCESRAFRLTPSRISAAYDFYDVVCVSEGSRLHAIIDADTGAYLKIEFTCAPELLAEWMRGAGEGFSFSHPYSEIMRNYALLNCLGDLNNLDECYTDGAAIQGFEAGVEETLFTISLKYSLDQGLLMLGVSAQPL